MNRVLLIARDETAGRALADSIASGGFALVEIITDARKAIPVFRQWKPDVVILDSDTLELDPFSIMKQLAGRVDAEEFLPFVLLAAVPDAGLKRSCLDARLTPFFQDPGDPVGLSLLVHELVLIRNKTSRLHDDVQRHCAEAKRVEREVARHLAQFAELKDHPASGHTARVGHLSALIALALGMSDEDVETIRLAAPLHDVGKIAIPDSILLKKEPLTLEELDIVKTHTTAGAAMLAGSTTPLFQMAEEIALYHHENWDGTGYTPGVEGEAVPMPGRIVRVADTFDALTSARHFAEKWRRDTAVDLIRAGSGQAFDPRVVEAFLDVYAYTEETAGEIAPGIL